MVTTKKKIIIFDDLGSGDEFELKKILYENEKIIVGEAGNEWYKKNFEVLIYKDTGELLSKDLIFYSAKN